MLSSNVDSWIGEVSGPLLARPMTGLGEVRASDAPGPIDVAGKGVVPSKSLRTRVSRLGGPDVVSGRRARVIRISANLVGAGGAALFAQASLQAYLRTHRLIGVAFFAEQAWVAVAYLVRRPARVVTRRTGDWLLAFGGTFGGVLFRPVGVHPSWGVGAGLGLQLLGLGIFVCSFFALGRSFGFAPADRGLVVRGPYAIVRHPVYACYFLLQLGYLLQSLSVRNALVMLFATGCNVGRALAEERLLASSEPYDDYRRRVRWRMLPLVW
jgi:protein-S-isoprenylcysteine O-methyltransferase Ste14